MHGGVPETNSWEMACAAMELKAESLKVES